MSAAQYRFLGTTDDQTECDRCGKVELRSVVILGVLDADGNVTDTLHYGSSCAARALASRFGVRATASKVLALAAAAQREAVAADADARAMLDHYGIPTAGDITPAALTVAAGRYREAHARGLWVTTDTDWSAMVLAMVARKRAALIPVAA